VGFFFEKVIEHTMCVLIFSFLILRRILWDYHERTKVFL